MRSGLFFILIMLAFSACEINGSKTIRGKGPVINESRNISSFSKLSIQGPFDAVITQSENESLRIEAEENLIPYIQVTNEDDRLRISIKRGYNIRSGKKIRVFVSGPTFEAISLAGSGDVNAMGKITGDQMDLSISGSGDAVMVLDAPVVKAEISGSGSVRFSGLTQTFDTEINGSGEVYAYDLLSEHTKIRISGSGDAQVYASKNLDIKIAGSGDVAYKGNPVVSQSVAGAGNIRRVE